MQGAGPQRAPPKLVLIVEDHELNLKLLNDLLEYHGYRTIVTGSGEAGVILAREHHPDLILLDIQLPDIPGTEVVRLLKADEETRSIPVIAVTAFAMSGDRTKFLAAGCDDYVPKPFDVREFLALVGRYANQPA